MLFLPLSNALGLGTSDEGVKIVGLTAAQIVYFVGMIVVLFGLGIEKFRVENHASDRTYAILFLIALHPLFRGLFDKDGGRYNLYNERSDAMGQEAEWRRGGKY